MGASKKATILTHILSKGIRFDFTSKCLQFLEHFNRELTSSPINKSLHWNQPYKLKWEVYDYAIESLRKHIPHTQLKKIKEGSGKWKEECRRRSYGVERSTPQGQR